jgi:hypothetical protein
MALEYPNIIHAKAKILGSAHGAGTVTFQTFTVATPSGNITFTANEGFTASATTHANTGVYVLPLDNPVDPNTSFAQANPMTGTDPTAFASLNNTGTTVTVTVNEAGAASDADNFSVVVYSGPSSP